MNRTSKIIKFTRGVPAPETLPVEKITESCAAILQEDGSTILQYYSAQGYSPLRESLAKKVGNNATKEQILVGNGSLQILNIIIHTMVSPGDIVLVESPTYDRAITAFSRRGAQVIGVPLEEDGINISAFEKIVREENPRLFYLIPDFQNPTGITTSLEKRKKILTIADKYDLKIVENTLYNPLRYYGKEQPTLWDLDSESVLHLSSFSKILSPGLRVGWVATAPEPMEKISQYAEDTYITSNMLSQGIVYKLLQEGWIKENTQHLKELYKPRLEATVNSLREYIPKAKWFKPEGGFFVGVWLPESTNMERVYEESEESGLILSPNRNFFPDHRQKHFLRIPFCALTKEEIREGIKRLANVMKIAKNV